MARELIHGIDVPVPNTGESYDVIRDLRAVATGVPDAAARAIADADYVEDMTPTEAVDLRATDRALVPSRGIGATPYLKTVSDMLNGEPLSVMVNVPAAQHEDIYRGLSDWEATTAIQELVADMPAFGTLVFPRGQFTRGNIQIQDKADFKLRGEKTRHVLQGTGLTSAKVGFQLVGTVSGVDIEGFDILGSGDKDDYHAGLWCLSGTEVDRLTVRNSNVAHTAVGWSVQANLGGDINLIDYIDCTASDIVGIDSGRGYGFHVAYLNAQDGHVRMINPRAIRCGRHSIYIARVGKYAVLDPKVIGHRTTLTPTEQADVTDGIDKTRSAILIARSKHGLVRDPFLTGGRGCAIQINANPDDEAGVECYDHTISGGYLADPQDSIPLMIMGHAEPSVTGVPEDITVQGTKFYADFSTLTGVNSIAAIQHNCGKNIRYRDLDITIKGVNVTTEAISVFNRQDPSGTADFSDDLSIKRVTAHLKTSNGSTCRAIRLDSTVCTSSARVETAEITPLGDCINEPVIAVAGVTNPNLRRRNRQGNCVGLYVAGDTTPSVARGVTHLVVANASATTITGLDDGVAGQEVTIRFADLNTTLREVANGGNFELHGGTDLASGTRDTVTLVNFDGGATWYQKAPKADN